MGRFLMTENEGKTGASAESSAQEPLPIWFFVGAILAVYGVLVLAGSLFGTPTNTVLKELHPGIWWGAMMIVFGTLFAWFGWHVHHSSNA
jgi:hypothetical protein